MADPRAGAAAALLSDGRVLVVGGIEGNGSVHNTAELYDPTSGQWDDAGLMNDYRGFYFSGQLVFALPLATGKVLVGGDPVSAGATAELYNPAGPPPPPPPPPANTLRPSISGSAVQGQTLTDTHGAYTNNPTAYAYQWQDCDDPGNRPTIAEQPTGQSYTLTGSDVGHTVRVAESASNAGGASAPVSSVPTAVGETSKHGSREHLPAVDLGARGPGQEVDREARFVFEQSDELRAPVGALRSCGQWVRGDPRRERSDVHPAGRGRRAHDPGARDGEQRRGHGWAGELEADRARELKSCRGSRTIGSRTAPSWSAALGRPTSRAPHPRSPSTSEGRRSSSRCLSRQESGSSSPSGSRVGAGTAAASRRRRLGKAKRCIRVIRIGALTRVSHLGPNIVTFSGRIGSRALKPGRYRATITATNPAKHTSRAHTITFTIVTR